MVTDSHAEFEQFLYDVMREHRPDFSEQDCRELAARTAGSVPDTESARRLFIDAFNDRFDKHHG